MGENVREDYDFIEQGFSKLPEHNSESTGFTASFVVANPTQDQSPVPYHHWQTWPTNVSAGGYQLQQLGNASQDTDAINFGQVKNHIHQWRKGVNASNQLLSNLPDPVSDQDAINKRYMVHYVANTVRPAVPEGGISWSAPIAEGGETVLDPPYLFEVASVIINGASQDETRGAYYVSDGRIYLSQGLMKGDQVQVIVGHTRPPGNIDWLLTKDDRVARRGQRFMLDSTAKPFTLTLPEQPIDGDRIEIMDVAAQVETHPVTILRNGRLIMGRDDDLIFGVNLVAIAMVFCGLELGWRILYVS